MSVVAGPDVGAGLDRSPWAAAGAALADGVNARLAGHPWRIAVAALGIRDELAVDEPAIERIEPGVVPVFLDGAMVVIGPVPRSGRNRPCSRCLVRRWQLVRSTVFREGIELGGETRAAGELPYVTAFGIESVAAIVTDLITAEIVDDGGIPDVHVIDLITLRTGHVRLVADSDCPACGDQPPDGPERAVIELRPEPKRHPDDFRLRPLSEIDVPIDAYVNEVCGVLGRGVMKEFDLPSTSTVIGSIAGRADGDLYEIFWGGHASSFATSFQVGMFEGLERYSGMAPRSVRPSTYASLDELQARGEPVLDPRDCGVYADPIYANDPEVVPFDSARAMPWVWGYSLRDRRSILVPQAITYYHSVPQSQRFVQECSNGCASGSSLIEAAYYGLIEIIERDAFLISWYGRAPLPEIDPRSSRRAGTRAMVDRLAMYGYTARFFDARITFGLPVVAGVAVRADGGFGSMCFGAGAGLDPEEAIAAALVEIATDSLHLVRRTRWDEERLRRMVDDFDEVLALDDHPRVYGLPEMSKYADFLLKSGQPKHSVGHVYAGSPRGSSDLTTDLMTCVDMVTAEGFDVIVVDQTAPEQAPLGLHTASVIVPGLVPVDFGWQRQRARHMPRTRTALTRAGLREHDLREEDLNPAPHPFP